MRSGGFALVALALALAGSLAWATPLAEGERAFLSFRDADDLARWKPTERHARAAALEADRVRALLSQVDDGTLSAEDRLALDDMRRALMPQADSEDAYARTVYAAYGRAAQTITFDGKTLDRPTVLGRLAIEPDQTTRRRLFLALAPVWETMTGASPSPSPYRELVRRRRASWAKQPVGSPFDRKAREWGLTPEDLESWLTRVLTAWRASAAPREPVEPWDWYYVNGAAERALAGSLPRERMIAVAKAYYRALGAAPRPLGVALDLAPRRGKDPVAFTDFVKRGRYDGGRWRDGRFRISASYATGGLGNLYELMHEMGHASHIAAIRARPAFDDWPDSDVFTEALADVTGLTAYEPEWQRRYVGAAADAGDAARGSLASSMLDIAWALFEIRVHGRDDADPNAIWAEITSRYLGIVPHPELSWWAMRGQLIDAPGYMTNYALGAIVAEALRARVRSLEGETALAAPTPELYRWLSDRLYLFGLAKPSRAVVEEFLGGPLSPDPLLARITEIAVAFRDGAE